MRRFLSLLVIATGTLVFASCMRVMLQRVMDYDEVAHAHAIWLTALGDVPFYDFFENHPPFPWFALAPIGYGIVDGDTLVLRLRILSFLGQIVFFALLVANMRRGRTNINPLWTCAALLIALTSEGNIGYLIEGRPDVWAAVALLGGILIARSDRLRPSVRYAAFGFLATASLFWSPKLIALAGLFGLLELVMTRRHFLTTLLSMMAGGAAATALALAILDGAGIPPLDAYAISIGYNTAFGRNGGWGRGLLRAVAEHWTVALPAAGGFLCWLAAIARGNLRPSSFEGSVAIFLIAQLILVPFPYKQYYAPWLFFAAVFIPFYSVLIDQVRLLRIVALPLALAFLCIKAALTYQIASAAHGFARTGELWRLLKSYSGENRRIVAPIAWHPITARDTLYATIGTTSANILYGPEDILRDLAHPVFSPRFTPSYYARELETNPPDVIVIGEGANALFPAQRRSVEAFLATYSADYERRIVGWQEVFVRR